MRLITYKTVKNKKDTDLNRLLGGKRTTFKKGREVLRVTYEKKHVIKTNQNRCHKQSFSLERGVCKFEKIVATNNRKQ